MNQRHTSLFACAVMLGVIAGPASAQEFNNPKVLDGRWSHMVTTELTGAVSGTVRSSAKVSAADSNSYSGGQVLHARAMRSASVENSVTGTDTAFVRWYIYEPDKVQRKGASAKLKQSGGVAVQLELAAQGESASGTFVISGCQAQARSKGDVDGASGLAWKLKCRDLFGTDGLNLTQAQADALIATLQLDPDAVLENEISGKTGQAGFTVLNP